MLILPAARDQLCLALADAVLVMVMTNTLPEALAGWVVRQLAEADRGLAAGLSPEARAQLPQSAPHLGDSLHQSQGVRVAAPLLRALTVALDTLAHTDDEEARARARRSVLEQLATHVPCVKGAPAETAGARTKVPWWMPVRLDLVSLKCWRFLML